MSKAQCVLCKDIISSEQGYTRCECSAIAVDDGRYLATNFDNLIKVKE